MVSGSNEVRHVNPMGPAPENADGRAVGTPWSDTRDCPKTVMVDSVVGAHPVSSSGDSGVVVNRECPK